ncbi:MAG: hypothetical protein IJL66_02925 [Lachnospiraceae bacterium]|nr:hypothetical protein [Lachnospiraceae bacterium]
MSVIRKKDDELELNFGELLRLLWKRAWIILLCAAITGGAALVYTKLFVTPKYRTDVTFYVNNRAMEGSTSLSQGDLNASAHLVSTYSAIIRSDHVMELAAAAANVPILPATFKTMVTAASVNNTEVFKVYVTSVDPQRAADLANGIADVVPQELSEIVEGSSVKVVDRAKVPTTQVSPNAKKNALLGAGAGFLAAVLAILLLAVLDNSIKSAADFERWKYPVLVSVPDFADAERMSAYGYGYGRSRSGRGTKQGGAAARTIEAGAGQARVRTTERTEAREAASKETEE